MKCADSHLLQRGGLLNPARPVNTLKSESIGHSVVYDSHDPMDSTRLLGPWNSPAKILEWVAIPFSRGIFRTQGLNPVLLHCRQILYLLSHQESPLVYLLLLLRRFSRVRLCATPQTAAYQAPPSMGFSRQEYWSGVPLPSAINTFNPH